MAAVAKVLAPILVLFAALWLTGCSRSPSEALLRETIDAMHKAGEERDVGGLMEHVAEDFGGQSASMDRRALSAFLLAVRMRTEKISITRTQTQIVMRDASAEAEISFIVTDGRGLLPTQGQLVRAQTKWRFESGAWMLTSANWNEGL